MNKKELEYEIKFLNNQREIHQDLIQANYELIQDLIKKHGL